MFSSKMFPSLGPEVVSFSVRLKRIRKGAATAKAKSDAHRESAEFAKLVQCVALVKIRDQLQDEIEAWKATSSQS